MTAACRILGGIALLLWAGIAAAQGISADIRPLSRDDAAALRVAAEEVRLASFRPQARPAHMVRYPVEVQTGWTGPRPVARSSFIPDARWDFRPDADTWTRAAMSALATHGSRLEDTVPRDIANWCPGYLNNPPEMRRAFWVGMMSALAKHESTWRPDAVGGGNLWFGLLQIYPDTARRYGCRAETGAELQDPEDNLSCAVRIMNVTVPRDNAIAIHDGRWRGVAADWGPMTNRAKIAEMSAWTRAQDYCQPVQAIAVSLRPVARPAPQATLSTMNGR